MPLVVPPHISGALPPNAGFSRALCEDVFNSPDSRADLTSEMADKNGDKPNLAIFSKNREWGIDVIGTAEVDGQTSVSFAFHVFNDLTESPLKEIDPRVIVRMMVERFGLNISVGAETRRFFASARVKVTPNQGVNLFSINNQRNDSYYSCMWFMVDEEGFANIEMAFCFNTTKYAEWVNSHGST